MKIETRAQIGDGIPQLLWEAHEIGAMVKANTSIPCSICRAEYERGIDEIKRTHFHGSDFATCARKVFLTMTQGRRDGISKAGFLNDGHIHEASMLDNIRAGMGNDVKLKQFKNEGEFNYHFNGFEIIGHTDALIMIEDDVYLIECKAVKEFNFRKIREEQEISADWYGQMQCYMLMLNIARGYLIVKHRETSQILMPIRIDRDAEFIASRLSVLNDIYTRINLGMEQPNREEKASNSFQCKFCSFREECWNA